MLKVIGCITDQHDIKLVILAALICMLACYTAFSLLARIHQTEKWSRVTWIAAATFATGGGVWATHFVAGLAFKPGVPFAYDLNLTLLSVAVSIVMSGIGLVFVTRYVDSIFGGGIVGLAICAMHYTGIAALRLPARLDWEVPYVLASIAISIFVSAFAFWVADRNKRLGGRLTASGLLVLAICGLHFTGMTAVHFTPDPTIAFTSQTIAPEWIALPIAVMMMLIVAAGLTGAVIDQRFALRAEEETKRLRAYVLALEEAKSELERTGMQLRTALDAAEAASETKSNFLATMSHELRTPLNAVIGFSEILKREVFGPIGSDRYREYSGDIFNCGTHLLALINDILDISRSDAGKLELSEESIDVNHMVMECVRLLQPQAQKADVTLQAAAFEDLPAIYGDSRRLRQILQNLISNALKFTPEGGEVIVRAAMQGEHVSIAVIDNGIGMRPEDIPIALERFGQIDSKFARKYQGTGLGLPLAKLLTELHDGRLEIESTLGQGTSVTVSFPMKRDTGAQQVA